MAAPKDDGPPFSDEYYNTPVKDEMSTDYGRIARAMLERYRKTSFYADDDADDEMRESIAGETMPKPIPLKRAMNFQFSNTRDQLRRAHEDYDRNNQRLIYETEVILNCWVHFGGKPLGVTDFHDGLALLRETLYKMPKPDTVQMNQRTAMELAFSAQSAQMLINNFNAGTLDPTIGPIVEIGGIRVSLNENVPGSMVMFFDQSGAFIFGFMAFGYRFTGTADDFGAIWRMPSPPRERTMNDYITGMTATFPPKNANANAQLSDEDLEEAVRESEFDDMLDEIFDADE